MESKYNHNMIPVRLPLRPPVRQAEGYENQQEQENRGTGTDVVRELRSAADLRRLPLRPPLPLLPVERAEDQERCKTVAWVYRDKKYGLGISVKEYKKLLERAGLISPDEGDIIEDKASEAEAPLDRKDTVKPTVAVTNAGGKDAEEGKDLVTLTYRNKKYRLDVSPDEYKKYLQKAGLI